MEGRLSFFEWRLRLDCNFKFCFCLSIKRFENSFILMFLLIYQMIYLLSLHSFHFFHALIQTSLLITWTRIENHPIIPLLILFSIDFSKAGKKYIVYLYMLRLDAENSLVMTMNGLLVYLLWYLNVHFVDFTTVWIS